MSPFQNIRLVHIVPDENQPRKFFDESAIEELCSSIKTHGVMQPILVRPNGPESYLLVCGERRYRASTLAGLDDIPAIVKEMTDEQALEMQIHENLIRKDVHPIEEAVAFKKLGERFSVEEMAERVGKSASFIFKRIKLAELVPDAQELYFMNKIEMKHAIMLSKLTVDAQTEVLKEVLPKNWKDPKQKVDTWQIEIGCDKNMVTLDKAPFKTNDAKLYPEAGACTKCPFNSANSPLLFDDMKGKICTKPSCYNIKSIKAEQAKLQELAANPDTLVIVNKGYLTDEEKQKIKSAKDLGVRILDDKFYHTAYKPDDTFLTFDEWLEENYTEDEDSPEERESQQLEYAKDKKKWEDDVVEYKADLKSGKIVLAYVLVGYSDSGKMTAIKLKDAAHAVISTTPGTVTEKDAPVLEEIMKIEQRESRNKELDVQKKYMLAMDTFKAHIPERVLAPVDEIALVILLADYVYEVRNYLKAKFSLDSDYDQIKLYKKLESMGTPAVREILGKAVRLACVHKLVFESSADRKKYGKAAAMMDMAEDYIQDEITALYTEYDAKVATRKQSVKKRIDALRKKLTPPPDQEAAAKTPAPKKSKKKAAEPVEETPVE